MIVVCYLWVCCWQSDATTPACCTRVERYHRTASATSQHPPSCASPGDVHAHRSMIWPPSTTAYRTTRNASPISPQSEPCTSWTHSPPNPNHRLVWPPYSHTPISSIQYDGDGSRRNYPSWYAYPSHHSTTWRSRINYPESPYHSITHNISTP